MFMDRRVCTKLKKPVQIFLVSISGSSIILFHPSAWLKYQGGSKKTNVMISDSRRSWFKLTFVSFIIFLVYAFERLKSPKEWKKKKSDKPVDTTAQTKPISVNSISVIVDKVSPNTIGTRERIKALVGLSPRMKYDRTRANTGPVT